MSTKEGIVMVDATSGQWELVIMNTARTDRLYGPQQIMWASNDDMSVERIAANLPDEWTIDGEVWEEPYTLVARVSRRP